MHELPPIVVLLAAAFTAAWVLGLVTQRLGLSPIVGYLLAGIVIGEYTPGIVVDAKLAGQLAEVGVMLLMFGVGLHFHVRDLLAVRRVAIPGALGQSLVATGLGVVVAIAFGMTFKAGLVLGMATAVASTVVLIRVLTDRGVLDTPAGHVAIGWLIVEDILTVIVLALIPAIATGQTGLPLLIAALTAIAKVGAMMALVLVLGAKLVPRIMVGVARLRSRELFTLTVLVMAIAVATGSAYVFSASMALGAFLAGMVVGQSPVSQQAAADILPLRDAFAVLFFASVGMLFDPMFVVHQPWLVLCVVAVVMVGKPLAALVIVAALGYPLRTGLTVALGLAQIGEFSFILSELGRKAGLVTDTGHNVLVAAALVSITLNPLIFRLVTPLETTLKRWPALWRFLNRNTRLEGSRNPRAAEIIAANADPAGTPPQEASPSEAMPKDIAVVAGFGPVGRTVDRILREKDVETIVIDLNMDTIQQLTREGRAAIYGDAYNIEVLAHALVKAKYLLITLPHGTNRNPLIAAAKLVNPGIKVFTRARYLSEGPELAQAGADAARFEEAEVAIALARLVLRERGESEDEVVQHSSEIKSQLRASAFPA